MDHMDQKKGILLPPSFFYASAVDLAPRLVGKILCRQTHNGVMRRRITETECYFGEEDSACHAHRGRTERTDVMYGEGGRAYVYLCYGIHSLLNIVTGPDGHPEAVLIRGVEGYPGPGRLTKQMEIDRSLNRALLVPESGIWLEDDEYAPRVIAKCRVGIDYASVEDRERLWRFLDACHISS